jgi:hypothetical protein
MIDRNSSVKVLRAFRDSCLARHNNDIDTMPAAERRNRLGKADKGDFLDEALAGLIDDPVDHIVGLLRSPRLLKTVLRRVSSTWERLHGEIDFDDILIANVLRFGAPEGYDFLLQRIMEIRGLRRDGIAHDADKRRKSLNDTWEQIANKVTWDKSAAYELAAFLFPELKVLGYSRKSVPQGVRHADPTDYWVRFNREYIEHSVIPDQEVLHAIATWKQDQTSVAFRGEALAPALFSNSVLSAKLEQFGPIFLTGNDVRALASGLFEVMLSRLGVKASEDSCDAFLGLWRVSLERDIPKEQHFAWVLPEILKALPISLRFADRLYYYWRHNDHNSVTYKEPCPEIHEPMKRKVKELFSDSPSRLIEALDPVFMYTVFHFVVHFSNPKTGGDGSRAADWRWLADTLVNAAQQNPRRALPQAIPFLVSEKHEMDAYTYEFNKDLAVEFFGDNLRVIMKLLAGGFDMTGFDDAENSRIEFARSFATKWLQANGFSL